MIPSLPRAGWLAVGAIAAALLAEGGRFASPLPAWPALAMAGTSIASAIVAAGLRHASLAAFLLAFGTVGLRAAAVGVLAGSAVVTPPLPAGSGTWDAAVTDVSSPNGAEQRAFVHLDAATPAEPGWLVYAWLPRYPALVPGDEHQRARQPPASTR